jgi:hypothetical protein
LIVSSSQWHGLLDISVFITITVYASTGEQLILIVSSSHWHGLLDILIVIKTEISNKPCQWEDDTIKTNSPQVDA